MKRGMFIMLIIATLVMSACEEKGNERAQKRSLVTPGTESLQMIGLGDSLTVGVGDGERREGYFGRVTEQLSEGARIDHLETSNVAKKGRTSAELLQQLREDGEVRRRVARADVIALTIGGNDVMAVMKQHLLRVTAKPFQEELPHFEERLRTIVRELEQLNDDALIVLTGIYNPVNLVTREEREFATIIDDWNDTMERLMQERPQHRVYVRVDDLDYSSNPDVYAADYFHPNEDGYDYVAERWLQTVRAWNAKRDEPLVWLLEEVE